MSIDYIGPIRPDLRADQEKSLENQSPEYFEMLELIDSLKSRSKEFEAIYQDLEGKETDASTLEAFAVNISSLEIDIVKISEKIEQIQLRFGEVMREVSFDAMTGLLKREAFSNAVRRKLSETKEGEAERKPRRGCIAMIDLNGMNKLNAQFGHLGTDRILHKFTDLANNLRAGDLGMRFAGDEFVLYLSASDPQLVGKVIVRRIHALLQKNPIIETDLEGVERQVDLTYCIGVSPLPSELPHPDDPDAQEKRRAIIEETTERADALESKAKEAKSSDFPTTILAYKNDQGEVVITNLEEILSPRT